MLHQPKYQNYWPDEEVAKTKDSPIITGSLLATVSCDRGWVIAPTALAGHSVRFCTIEGTPACIMILHLARSQGFSKAQSRSGKVQK